MECAVKWNSFEELRVGHAANLAQIEPRTYGELQVKRETYAVLRRQDFNALRRAQQFENLTAAVEVLELALPLIEAPALLTLIVGRVRAELDELQFHATDATGGS